MAGALLEQQVKPIATNAMIAMFQGENDTYSLAQKFGSKFAQKFANAIYAYVATCTCLPTGGPIVAGSIATLSKQLIETAHDALLETFQGEDDPNILADKFAKPFGTFANAMLAYMPTCQAVLATPPTMSVTPGGWLLVPPSTSCVPVMYQCAYQGIIATFQNEADTYQLAIKFATIMQQIGSCIQPYVLTCVPISGGGPLPAK